MQRAAWAGRMAAREQDWLHALRRGLVERLLGRLPAVPRPGSDRGDHRGDHPGDRRPAAPEMSRWRAARRRTE